VFLSHNDLEKVAHSFRLEYGEFIERYCRFVDMNEKLKLSFIEKDNYDCIFWEKNGCSIYEARPIQCRSYPFWSSHLKSHRDWADLASFCPGVGRGKSHSQISIESWLHAIEKEDYDFSRYKKSSIS
jgi:Fe-S-cluster containining protein